MSILDLYKTENGDAAPSHADLKRSRPEVLHQASEVSRFDVIVAGGGIQGACFARLAAFNGMKVLLLEAKDYGSGTSGRTSKMAHGGLRYLEYFDLRQVMEGVKAREELLQTASHLVSAEPFLIPIFRGELFKKLKLSLGLAFYDRFLRDKHHRHRSEPVQPDYAALFGREKVSSFIRFYDGIMHDVRLVLENIYAARQEGAICLNYARVDSIHQQTDTMELSWTDTLSGTKYVSRAGIVINTAGPWAPTLGRVVPDRRLPQVRYSRGTHLIFSRRWNYPAMLIPLPGRGRNYFIWPHFAGTLVGTTEKEVPSPEFDPVPLEEEIDELMARLSRDVPGSGLNNDNLIYAFTGIRTLPAAKPGGGTFKLSRRHIWAYSQGVLTLLGGKFTSAYWTAEEGMRLLYKYAGLRRPVTSLKGRVLPGTFNYSFETSDFRSACSVKKIPKDVIDSCIRRHGSKVRILTELDPELRLVAGKLLLADLIFALEYEQAATIDDILSRRTDLEYQEGSGLDILDQLPSILNEIMPGPDWQKQAEIFRKKVQETVSRLPGNRVAKA